MSEFWIRESVVSGCGREFRYPDYEIQFRIDFAKGGDPDLAVIGLYNLAPETEQVFKHGEEMVLRAGYQEDIGIVMAGEIRHVRVFDEGADRICEIEVHDTSDAYQGAEISESYVPGTTGSQILERIISMSGLERGKILLVRDAVYPEGRSVDGKIKDVIKEIAEDCGSEAHVTHGTIHVLPPGGWHDEAILLSPKTGLIGSPKRIESDDENSALLWEAESLLNYRIRAGTLVQVESKQVHGLFAVESGSHVSDGNEFKTVLQLAEPEGL